MKVSLDFDNDTTISNDNTIIICFSRLLLSFRDLGVAELARTLLGIYQIVDLAPLKVFAMSLIGLSGLISLNPIIHLHQHFFGAHI